MSILGGGILGGGGQQMRMVTPTPQVVSQRVLNVVSNPPFIDTDLFTRSYSFWVHVSLNAVPAATQARVRLEGSYAGAYAEYVPNRDRLLTLDVSIPEVNVDPVKALIDNDGAMDATVQFANAAGVVQYEYPFTIPAFVIPARAADVRGQLIATATFRAGTHPQNTFADWTLDGNAPSQVSASGANLDLPPLSLSTGQLGYWVEFVENGTVLRSGLFSSLDTPDTSLDLFGSANAVQFVMFSEGERRSTRMRFRTVRRGDTVVPRGSLYEMKVYVAEN